MKEEHVVLVDEQNNEIGIAPKATIHGIKTPLHRAFSCFLFNSEGDFLIQQRAFSKKTWPGVWSNSVCGHPLPGESTEKAVHRRIQYELGIKSAEIFEALPNFQYCASFQGIQENEICPVWVGFTRDLPKPNPEEVESTQWINWENFINALKAPADKTYDHFSIWSQEESILLDQNQKFIEFRNSLISSKK